MEAVALVEGIAKQEVRNRVVFAFCDEDAVSKLDLSSVLFVVKIQKRVQIINATVDGAEFHRKCRGGGSQGLLGQNGFHLPLDGGLLSLQLLNS